MLTKQNIMQFLTENKEYFRKEFHVSKIGLFGSFARGEQRSDSDIDILIELETDTQNIYDLKWELREYLQKKLNRNVDVCTEKYIKSFAKEMVLRDAIYA
ncbi:MAG: hypothetical protein POELPBGB_01946 [Bacteroidia bacterium]|nr:hypothetical protein [Bacteroidia bacterium]